MNRLIRLLAIAVTAAMLIPFVVGCAPVAHAALGNIPMVGSEVDQISAYLASADAAIESARAHADPVGQSALALAHQANASAAAKAKQVGGTLGKVQADFNAQEKQIQPLKDRVTQLTTSKWYKLGQFLNWCKWALITLCFVHYVLIGGALIIRIFWPLWEPVAKVLAWLGKIIWPVGWAIAILGYFEKKAEVTNAITNTASLPPDTLTAPPTPAQIKVLKKPKQKGDASLVRQLNAIPPVIPPREPAPVADA
jgi:hypothetical protein